MGASAAASATGGGGAAAGGVGCTSESSVSAAAGAGSADGFALDGSGQREAINGGGTPAAGAVTGGLIEFRPVAAGCGAVAALLSAASRADVTGSSARAFATEPRIGGSAFGAIGYFYADFHQLDDR